MPSDARLLLLDKDAVEALLQVDDVSLAVREALFVLHSNREGRVFPVVRESLPTGGIFGRGKRELPEGLPEKARLFVDDQEQASQTGELQWAPQTPCTEPGDLLTGKMAFRRAPADITIFDMTGLALQDLAVARLLYKKALAIGAGTDIAWP